MKVLFFAVIGVVLVGIVIMVASSQSNVTCSEGVACDRKMCIEGFGSCSMWEWACKANAGNQSELQKSCPAIVPIRKISFSSNDPELVATSKCAALSTHMCDLVFRIPTSLLSGLDEVIYCPSRKQKFNYEMGFSDSDGFNLKVFSSSNIRSPLFDDRTYFHIQTGQTNYVYPCYREGRARIAEIMNIAVAGSMPDK